MALINNHAYKIGAKFSGRAVRNGNNIKKAIIKRVGGKFYLFHNCGQVDQQPMLQLDRLHGFHCATLLASISESAVDAVTIEDLHATTFEIDNYTITLYTDSATLASLYGGSSQPQSTEQNQPQADPVADANPYMLSNYTDHTIWNSQARYHRTDRSRMNTPINAQYTYRIGVELEVEFASHQTRDEFVSTPRNWFFCEDDGSLREPAAEIITIPLLPEDAKNRNTWKPICKRLKEMGATSWDTGGRCGLHVHIGREALGSTEEERNNTLGKLLFFYDCHLNDDVTATKVFGRTRCYHELNHRESEMMKAIKILGQNALKDKGVADGAKNTFLRMQTPDHCRVINTQHSATIEFRKGRGSLSADRIQSIITFCESAVLFCRATECMADLTPDNFRDWIRANVPCTNALYNYYSVIDAD